MLFDKFCKFAESPFMRERAPFAEQILRRSAIFSLEKEHAHTKANNLHGISTDEFRTLAIMPFPDTWIESGDTATLLSTQSDMLGDDMENHRAAAIRDMPKEYSVVEWLPSLSSITVCGPIRTNTYSAFLGLQHYCIVNVDGEDRTQYLSIPGIHFFGQFDDRGVGGLGKVTHFEPQAQEAILNLAKAASRIALASLLLINDTKINWIVSREHIMARPIQKGKIARSDQRIRYIVVGNKDIDRVIRDPNPENVGTVRPHRRRAHTHLLKSEKFTWKRGERVFVKATWVGPQQATYGGERYTVCLDL